MPTNPYPNVGSQLDRALRALFIQEGAMPQPDLPNGGIFLTLDQATRTNPLRTIHAYDAQESTMFAGNLDYHVQIVDQFAAAPQPGMQNPELHRVQMDLQVGKMMTTLHLSENGANLDRTVKDITDAGRALAETGVESPDGDPYYDSVQDLANNEDMAEFTCLFVVPMGHSRGHPTDGDTGGQNKSLWTEVRRFRITVAPVVIVGYSNNPGE